MKRNIEVIVVDDGSREDQRIQKDHLTGCDFPIHVYRIGPHAKKWINPVIPFNLGISKAKGEWILLQNPEVCHVGDICAYLSKASPASYHVMRVYALDKTIPGKDFRGVIGGSHGDPYKMTIAQCKPNRWKENGMPHQAVQTGVYHFCAAIHSSRLDILGGFNSKTTINF